MKRILIINLFVIFTFDVSIIYAVLQSQYNHWDNRLSSQFLSEDSQTVNASTEEHKWPEIVSIQCKTQLSLQDQKLNIDFRALSHSLLKKVDEYHNEIKASTDEHFSAKITPLIELRNKIAMNPSYVNYTLVDHINRILVVNTAERLVKSIPLPIEIGKVVSNICIFSMDINRVKIIFEKENKKNYNLNISNSFKKTKFEKLWNEISTDSNYVFPKKSGNAISYDMIDEANIELILYRMYITSPYIISLSYMLEYRELDSDYSLNDSYQKIKSVLINNKNTIETDLPGTHNKVSMVGQLINRVKSNRINYLLDSRIKEIKNKN